MTQTPQLELIAYETLTKGYKLLKAKGMRMATSAEIIGAGVTNPELRNLAFDSANVGLYGVKDGKVWFSLGESEEFERIIGNNIDEVCNQSRSNYGNYRLSKKDKLWVAERQKSREFAVFNLESDFGLSGIENEFGYFCFLTKNKETLEDGPQKTLAEIAYGKGKDLDKAMKMFAKAGVKLTQIWVLKPDYVRQKVQEESMIARACWLKLSDSRIKFSGSDSSFGANAKYGDTDSPLALLGVHREEISVGDALKNQGSYRTAAVVQADNRRRGTSCKRRKINNYPFLQTKHF